MPQSNDEIVEIISEIVARVLYLDRSQFNKDSKLILDLHADSVDIIDIVFEAETKFNVRIDFGPLPELLQKSRPSMSIEDIAIAIEHAQSQNDKD